MTRKEEIEKASKIRADQYSHHVAWNECYHHFKEGAEWADSHPASQWHKVEDGLPSRIKETVNISKAVLVTNGLSYGIGYYNYNLNKWFCVGAINITHWIELPELPKKKED